MQKLDIEQISVTNFDHLSEKDIISLGGYDGHIEYHMRLIYGYAFEKKIPAQLLPRIFEMGLAAYNTLQHSVKILPEMSLNESDIAETKPKETLPKIIFPESVQL